MLAHQDSTTPPHHGLILSVPLKGREEEGLWIASRAHKVLDLVPWIREGAENDLGGESRKACPQMVPSNPA